MTKDELHLIIDRAKNAEDGPWEFESIPAERVLQVTTKNGHNLSPVVALAPHQNAISTRNMYFIAHARQDVEYLVAEVRRLQSENEQMKETFADRMDGLSSIRHFVERVNEQAEQNMLKTGVVAGAHWNAMKQVMAEMDADTKELIAAGVL